MTIQSNSNNVIPTVTIKADDDFEDYKVYLLRRIYESGTDEFIGKVVVASSGKSARKIANLKHGDEGPIWTDASQVLCREISLTAPMIVLESFNAG